MSLSFDFFHIISSHQIHMTHSIKLISFTIWSHGIECFCIAAEGSPHIPSELSSVRTHTPLLSSDFNSILLLYLLTESVCEISQGVPHLVWRWESISSGLWGGGVFRLISFMPVCQRLAQQVVVIKSPHPNLGYTESGEYWNFVSCTDPFWRIHQYDTQSLQGRT